MHKTKVMVRSYDAYGNPRTDLREVASKPHAVSSLFNQVPMVESVRVTYDDGSYVVYTKEEE